MRYFISAVFSMFVATAAGASDVLAQTPRATPQPAQGAQATVRSVERPQGAQRVIHTEVRPDVWVHGKPQKQLFVGDSPVIPEAYDYFPALAR